MRAKWTLLAVAVGAAVAACGSGSESEIDRVETSERETVFDPLTQTLDRAEGVQQTLDERAAEQRRRLEEEER